MLFDLLFYLGGVLLQAVALVFSAILPFSLPATLYSPMAQFLAQLGTLGGVLDLPVFFQCLAWLVSFELVWVGFLIIWYVVGFFRGLFSVGGTAGHNQ